MSLLDKFIIVVYICVHLEILSILANPSELTLHNGVDNSSSTVILTLRTNAPDLNHVPELNGSLSYCMTGQWLFYTEKDYHGETTVLSEWEKTCAKLPVSGYPFSPSAGKIVSARYMGYQDNSYRQTATFFDGVNATGKATMYDIGMYLFEKIDFSFSSILLTGPNAAITFYQREDGVGFSKCFQSGSDYVYIYWTDIEFYEKIMRGDVRSIRNGCQSPNVFTVDESSTEGVYFEQNAFQFKGNQYRQFENL